MYQIINENSIIIKLIDHLELEGWVDEVQGSFDEHDGPVNELEAWFEELPSEESLKFIKITLYMLFKRHFKFLKCKP